MSTALLLALLAAPPGQWMVGRTPARIHPTRQERAQSANGPVPGKFALPHLAYYGGQILDHVKVVGVYWDLNRYFADDTDGVRAYADGFYAAFLASSLFDWLSEYGTTSQPSLGHGSYAGGVLIVPDASRGGMRITSNDLQAELAAQIDAGHLLPPDPETLYQLHLPPGVTVTDSGISSCVTYCAYHDSFVAAGKTVFFSLIPDHRLGGCSFGCGENPDWRANMTASASHEIVEAVTDADVGASSVNACGPAWCDPSPPDYASDHQEIGDICAQPWGPSQGATSNTLAEYSFGPAPLPWWAQREWSNKYNACLGPAADAFSLSLSPGTVRIHGQGSVALEASTTAPANPAGKVTLGLFKLPAGVTAAFSPPTIAAGGKATLQLTIDPSVKPFSLMAFANSGPTLAYALAQVDFDDFTVTSRTASISLRPGGMAAVSLDTALAPGSLPQSLSIQLAPLPGLSIPAATVAAGQSTTVVIRAGTGTPTTHGQAILTVTNGLRAHSVSIPINVDGDDFSVTGPAAVSVPIGGSARFDLATATTNGAAQPLAASLPSSPTGITASFDPPSVVSGQPIHVTLSAASQLHEGPQPLVLTVSGVYAVQEVRIDAGLHAGGCNNAGPALPEISLPLFALWLVGKRRRRSRLGPRSFLEKPT